MTYLCGTFFLKCPAGEQCGIHQAKNVVFFQIQVAFSALRHWVSDNRRVFFFFLPQTLQRSFYFFSCWTGRLCKHPCFLFFRHCRERWGFGSQVMLIWVLSEVMLLRPTDRNFPLADRFNRKQSFFVFFLQQEVVAAETSLSHWPICALGV